MLIRSITKAIPLGDISIGKYEIYEGFVSPRADKFRRCTQPEDIAAALHRYGDVEELQGLSSLDEESQDQVKKSFQAGYVVDTDWRGVSENVMLKQSMS